jgi:glycerol-3-phosphate dehydrogenase (NAD(P)+)
MAKVAVMGAGSWGTTFAKILADAGNDVTIWARRDDVVEEINTQHRNGDYLPGIKLPKSLKAVFEPAEAMAGSRAGWRKLG